MADQLNKFSSRITQPKSQGASQAMLYATGLTEEDMNKPQVGIASVWYEGNPCNMHLLDLAAEVKQGVSDAGLVGMRFNTVGVSDEPLCACFAAVASDAIGSKPARPTPGRGKSERSTVPSLSLKSFG